mgnify:CR=1 FL=1
MSETVKPKITQHNFLTTFKDYVDKFVKDYNEGLFALVWALITFGLERLLDKETFNCPKTGYQGYGIAFFVCPIVMLTLLNWLTMPAEGGYLSGRYLRDVGSPPTIAEEIFLQGFFQPLLLVRSLLLHGYFWHS